MLISQILVIENGSLVTRERIENKVAGAAFVRAQQLAAASERRTIFVDVKRFGSLLYSKCFWYENGERYEIDRAFEAV